MSDNRELYEVKGKCQIFKQELVMPVKATSDENAVELAKGYYSTTPFSIDPATLSASKVPKP